MKEVKIYTDGACSGNPGPGGWGVILRYADKQKELSGGAKLTTNNRMELTGVIEGLLALNEPCKVELTTDSRYVSDSVSKKWVYSWQKNNWIKNRSSGGSGDKAVPNADLWQKLLPLLELHTVEFNWIRGHTGHTENERCDALAVSQREKFKGGS